MSFPESPDDRTRNSPDGGSTGSDPTDRDEFDLQPRSPEEAERFQKARNSAKRLYLILLAIGLGIGILVSIGVVSLLQRFGLTDVPDQFEQVE